MKTNRLIILIDSEVTGKCRAEKNIQYININIHLLN